MTDDEACMLVNTELQKVGTDTYNNITFRFKYMPFLGDNIYIYPYYSLFLLLINKKFIGIGK